MEVKDFDSTIEWYNQNAKEYAKKVKSLGTPHYFSRFIKLLPKGSKVLDLGCAAGRDTEALSKAGFDVTGIDISRGLIIEARKSVPDCKFIEGNFLDLPFEDKTFEGIWAQMSFLHLETAEDIEKAFSEMARVTKPGGIVHFAVKAQTTDKKTDVVADIYGNHKRFFRYYKLDEIRNLFETNNFELIELKQIPEAELKGSLNRANTELIIALAKML